MDSFEIKDIVKHFVGQANVLAVPAIFKKWLGSYNAAVLFGQIIYWTERTTDENGWFFKSYKNWESEIFLTEREAKTAADHLISLGLIETKIAKIAGNPTKHYRLKTDVFSKLFTEFLQQLKTAQVVENKELEGNRQNVGNETDETAVSLSSQNLLTNTTHTESVREPSAITAQTGIHVGEVLNVEPSAFTQKCLEILETKRMDSPLSMPEWSATIAYAEKLSPDPMHFAGCIEAVEKWARSRVTPKMVADNYGKYLTDLEKQNPPPENYEIIETKRTDNWKNWVSTEDVENIFNSRTEVVASV